jgi:hypothetical protein
MVDILKPNPVGWDEMHDHWWQWVGLYIPPSLEDADTNRPSLASSLPPCAVERYTFSTR